MNFQLKIFKVILALNYLSSAGISLADDVITAMPIVLNSSANFASDRVNIIDFQKNKEAVDSQFFSSFRSQKVIKKFIKWENNLLKYNRIEISGLKKISKNTLLLELFPEGNPWMWSFDTADLKQKILRSPWIESVEISSTIYPARLFIKVKEVNPWLITDFGKVAWLLSDQGKLIQSLSSIKDPNLIFLTLNLPRLDIVDKNSAIEKNINNSRLNLAINQIKLFEHAGGMGFKVEAYRLLDDSSLEISGQAEQPLPKVYISINNIEEAILAVKRLKNIMLDLSKRNHLVEKIDLRFARQAVVK